jgi:hypothetical protein
MPKICPICGANTYCTDNCRGCAKETAIELKEKLGEKEYAASEEEICEILGTSAFTLLRDFGFLRLINTNKQGKDIYLVLEGGN